MWVHETDDTKKSFEMLKKPKAGRPFLPEGEAKGRIVSARFKSEDLKKIETAAKANRQTVSEWIRATVGAAIQ